MVGLEAGPNVKPRSCFGRSLAPFTVRVQAHELSVRLDALRLLLGSPDWRVSWFSFLSFGSGRRGSRLADVWPCGLSWGTAISFDATHRS